MLVIQYPLLSGWFQVLAVFSMSPLLHRDKLALPAAVLLIIFMYLSWYAGIKRSKYGKASCSHFTVAILG